MAEKYQPEFVSRQAVDAGATFDAGLRSHMLKVYNYMTSGVLLTGIIALYVGNSPALLNTIFGSGLGIVVMLAPLGFVLGMSFGLNKMRASTLQALFWGFAGLMGLSLSTIFVQYTDASIARVFFVTAIMFASLSLYGYTTKKSLSGWGTFLFMGLIGIIIASVVNMFMQSSAMQFIISVVGVLIFAGLTAYDTQKIKEMYYEADGTETASKKAIMGALTLYLDFINMFLMMLRLFGNRN
jgi:hypothetical protein